MSVAFVESGLTSSIWPDRRVRTTPRIPPPDLPETSRRTGQRSRNASQARLKEATEIDAKVSETGRYLSFLRDKNMFVMDAATGREHALTTDGGGTLSWGAAEFVAQEELSRFTGYWWSPDDRYIAVARVDESPVAIVKRAAIGASGTELIEQRYPAAGTRNAIVDLYAMTPEGQRVKADLGSDPDFYLARVDWAKDGRSIFVQRLSRDQKRLDVLRIDPATGSPFDASPPN